MAKQVFQLIKGDEVKVPKGKKYVKEQVISIKIDEHDERITYVTTESGVYDSYSFGYVM